MAAAPRAKAGTADEDAGDGDRKGEIEENLDEKRESDRQRQKFEGRNLRRYKETKIRDKKRQTKNKNEEKVMKKRK